MKLLRGSDNPSFPVEADMFHLMAAYAGNKSIRESRLLQNAILNDSTTPIDGTIYIDEGGPSLTECSVLTGQQARIYSNEVIRLLYIEVAQDTSYALDVLRQPDIELIAPIVDCSSTDITDDDISTGRFFFLVRNTGDTDDVRLVIISLSNQQYLIPELDEKGLAAVATIQQIKDMRQTDLDFDFVVSVGFPYENSSFRVYEYIDRTANGLLQLRSIPASEEELVKELETAYREGFYIKAESEQSNINNAVWIIEQDSYSAVGTWRWTTKPVLHDSWARVHGIQFLIGFLLMANLVILCLATYRNVQSGKWWIGDGFVSITTSQMVNGVAVLISWFMNEYWCLHEFCFGIGSELSEVATVYVYDLHMRADLYTIYLTACGVIGHLLKERIDPFFAALCFYIGFDGRLAILRAFPVIHGSIVEYATLTYKKGVRKPMKGQDKVSPMSSRSTHPHGVRNYSFVTRCLFPIYVTLIFIVAYVGVRKVYRKVFPDITPTGKSYGLASGDECAVTSAKRVLTLFEIATGAELENRYGVVSDYETCVFIKGMKFASADGIYSTGFVIANKKFLLQTGDYWTVVLMKLLRYRVRSIYVDEVSGSTVQQTARLVYPHTFSMTDLLYINVTVLT